MMVFMGLVNATEISVGTLAPLFKVQTHEGKDFDLASRKGQWTVLYFYPQYIIMIVC